MQENNKLGLVACIALVTGGCIGSAIYSLSGMTMYYAGPAAIISWIVAALIMGIYGMQVAELASRYPHSGGTFTFPQLAFGGKSGELWGFISAWGYMVSNIIAVAFSAIYVGTYLSVGFPAMDGKQIPLALIAVAFCMVLNLLKITDAGRFNNLLVGALILTMLIYGAVAIFGGTFDTSLFSPLMTQGIKGSSGWISAIPVASVAYGSCISIAFMVSEVKNPNRTIPKAIIIGLIIVTCLYMTILVGTLGNLNVGVLMDDANAFFRYVPIFAAIWTSGLGQFASWMAPLISISALLALLTTMLVVLAINARTMQAVAQNGYFPAVFAKENKNGVPGAATIVMSVLAALLCLRPDWTEILVGLGALFSVVTIVITCYALIVARKKTELSPEQFRAPGGNVLPWITIVLLIACYIPDIIAGAGQLLAFTAIIYAVGVLIYFLGSKKKQ